MTRFSDRIRRLALGLLAPADALMNRLYTWRFNPLYHSGALVVVFFLIILVTGIYLLFFYRIGAPYASVERLRDQWWLGGWIRSLHRYASDGAVVAILIHMFRMFAQGRSWGPRALAWVSGLVMLFVVLVSGWTGYVMVWDVQGLLLAREGARLLDLLPLFSEPIGRTFVGERELPGAFFFLNLFLHVALPVGLALGLWVHVSRVARAALLPPRGLSWTVTGGFLALSLLLPAALGPAADLFRLPDTAPLDVFYSLWLPLSQAMPAWTVWISGGAVSGLLLLVPWLAQPAPGERAGPSVVNERLCTGCTQCWLDCPYEAIAMISRADGREGQVARVDSALCVSCGICAGSCAPMGVGPPARTGRDQLARVTAFVKSHPLSGQVVAVACTHGAGGIARGEEFHGAPVFAVECAGSLHTSVVEYLVRSGAGGVLIVSCSPRDCWHREGPRWLEERLYHDREAELKARVDRRRVRVAYAGLGERAAVRAALLAYQRDVTALDAARAEERVELDFECEPPAAEVVER
ncbi:MAG TPA: cytochrome b N-terminal domain-containing protein [Gemmatimonadales bacterium]|nr:cytochrome b N-terminal domain-containing protein [Gemmatimonadales bacterium]